MNIALDKEKQVMASSYEIVEKGLREAAPLIARYHEIAGMDVVAGSIQIDSLYDEILVRTAVERQRAFERNGSTVPFDQLAEAISDYHGTKNAAWDWIAVIGERRAEEIRDGVLKTEQVLGPQHFQVEGLEIVAQARDLSRYTREYILRKGPVSQDEDPFHYGLLQDFYTNDYYQLALEAYNGAVIFSQGMVDIIRLHIVSDAREERRLPFLLRIKEDGLLAESLDLRSIGVSQDKHKDAKAEEYGAIFALEDNGRQAFSHVKQRRMVMLIHQLSNEWVEPNPYLRIYDPNNGGFEQALEDILRNRDKDPRKTIGNFQKWNAGNLQNPISYYFPPEIL